MGKTRKRLVRGTYGIRTGFTEQECSRRRTTPISCAQVQDPASGGISSFPGEVTSEIKGGRNARLGLDSHHRAAGSAVDRRRLRTPIVTRGIRISDDRHSKRPRERPPRIS